MATATQVEAHRAKMKRKAARVLPPAFNPVEGKRFAAERFRLRTIGRHIFPNVGKSVLTYTSHAQVNCKSGLVHEHKREIARHLRQDA